MRTTTAVYLMAILQLAAAATDRYEDENIAAVIVGGCALLAATAGTVYVHLPGSATNHHYTHVHT